MKIPMQMGGPGDKQTITQNNYTVEYILNGKIACFYVYRNSSVNSDADVNITLPFNAKIKAAVPAYVCKNGSLMEINGTNLRVLHKVGDGWYAASCTVFISK